MEGRAVPVDAAELLLLLRRLSLESLEPVARKFQIELRDDRRVVVVGSSF